MNLIIADRFAKWRSANDEPRSAWIGTDRAKARAYHGGDLRGIRETPGLLKGFGRHDLHCLTPIVKNGAAEITTVMVQYDLSMR